MTSIVDASESLLLSIRCVGLNPSSKTITQNSGMFTSLYSRATGVAAKNEKRTVKLSQSEPFKPTGRPPNLNYGLIYSSETFEDVADITPSLIAEVKCPEELDVKLRLNVYYSSSLTGNKDILLAGTTFSKRELIRSILSMNVLVAEMTSEHCSGSKAYIELVKPLSPVLYDKSFKIVANRKENVNPLVQKYVFYNDVDNLTPYIDAEEYNWEPKFSAKIPLLFLENFTASLIRSTYSWNLRYEFERMRQGRFHNMEEALQFGWHSVTITVLAARIGVSRSFKERTKGVQNQIIAAQQVAMNSGNPSAANINLPIYTYYTPNEVYSGSGLYQREQSEGYVVGERTNSTATTGPVGTNKSFVSQWNTKKYDETAPNTFVEISIEDSSQTFISPVGRTNTEYYTMEPIYGSNLHATYGRKANTSAVAATDTVQLITSARDFEFSLYELTDRDYLYAPNTNNSGFIGGVTPLNNSSNGGSAKGGNANKVSPTPSVDGRSNSQEGRNSNASGYGSITHIQNPIATVKGTTSTDTPPRSNSRSTSVESTFNTPHNTLFSASSGGAGNVNGFLNPPPTSTVPSAYGWIGAVKAEPDNVISVMGKETHFYQYVSQCDEKYNTAVKFDFCLEDSSGNAKRIGQCRLPLRAGERTDAWLPVKVLPIHPSASEDSVSFEDIELHVVVNVKSPDVYNLHNNNSNRNSAKLPAVACVSGTVSGNSSINGDHQSGRLTPPSPSPTANPSSYITNTHDEGSPNTTTPEDFVKAPASMHEMYLYQRNIAGVPQQIHTNNSSNNNNNSISGDNVGSNGDEKAASPVDKDGLAINNVYSDYKGTISDCYEWMWHLGFNGTDPLVSDNSINEALPQNTKNKNNSITGNSNNNSNVNNIANNTVNFNNLSVRDDSIISHDSDTEEKTQKNNTRATANPRKSIFSRGKKPLFAGKSDKSDKNSSAKSQLISADSDDEDGTAGVSAKDTSLLDGDDEDMYLDTDFNSRKSMFDYNPHHSARDNNNDLLDFSEFDNENNNNSGNISPTFTPAVLQEDSPTNSVDGDSPSPKTIRRDPGARQEDSDDEYLEEQRDSEYHGVTSPGAYFPEDTVGLSAVPDDSVIAALPESAVVGGADVTNESDNQSAATAADTGIPTAPTLQLPSSAAPSVAIVNATAGNDNSAAKKVTSTPQYLKHARVDFPYSLAWMRGHIDEMEKLSFELRSILPDIRRRVKNDLGFRSSTLKKQVDVQPLPINLHYQILGVRSHAKPENKTEVIHSITCGSMSPHMLGHKKGGLFYQESNLVLKREELDKLKRRFVQRRTLEGTVNLNTHNSAYQLLNHLGESVTKFEESCLTVGYRRVFAISQSLSIAVNALLLKLNLAVEGQIAGATVEKWMTDGFLIVFEGLLSVISHERSMLEDTISAVDALKSFQVRIKPLLTSTSTSTKERRRASNTSIILEPVPSATNAGGGVSHEPVAVRRNSYNTTTSRFNDTGNASNSSDNLVNVGVESGQSDAQQQQQEQQQQGKASVEKPVEEIDIDIQGREVVIYVPMEGLAKLPAVLQEKAIHSGGAVINFVPVLFTQGIDIQQTMATNGFGGDKKGKMKSADLQHYVNVKALTDINAYAYKAQPINISSPSGTSNKSAKQNEQEQLSPHPIINELFNIIHSSSITMKNIDMLIEVERVCLMLAGCRVTFCKSGKDRTGMAVTLEQSRQLGERYGCGISTSRTLRDANLMRLHGVRILIAEKNIGRKIYSINKLQVQFLPMLYRPPLQVCEDMMKKDNS